MSKQQTACDKWNADNPIGTAVDLLRDTGSVESTSTTSEAYVCEFGYPVIFLKGVRGYYLLSRVTAREIR